MLAARLVLRTVRGVETKGWRARRLTFEPQRLALTVVLEDDTEQHVRALAAALTPGTAHQVPWALSRVMVACHVLALDVIEGLGQVGGIHQART